MQGGARGHHVIDQYHPLATQAGCAGGLYGEGASQIAQPLHPGQAALGLGGVQAQQLSLIHI